MTQLERTETAEAVVNAELRSIFSQHQNSGELGGPDHPNRIRILGNASEHAPPIRKYTGSTYCRLGRRGPPVALKVPNVDPPDLEEALGVPLLQGGTKGTATASR